MNLRKLALGVIAVPAMLFLSGCVFAHHSASGKHHTVVLGGLVEVQEGAFEAQPKSTLPLNRDKPEPGSKMNGNKVSVLWGLFSYRSQ